MLASYAIKLLQELKPEHHIIIAWWDNDDCEYTEDEWDNIINREGKIDWHDINDQMDCSSED